MLLGSRLRLPAQRGARRDGLGATVIWAVALAPGAVGVDDHVAELGARASGTAIDLTVDDQPAADPRPDRQEDGVSRASRGAPPVFGESGGVRVVVEHDRDSEPLGHDVPDRDVDDRQVDRADRDAALLIDRAWNSKPGGARLWMRFERSPELGLHRVEDLRGRAAEADLLHPVEYLRAFRDDAHEHLRAAQIGANRNGWPGFAGRRCRTHERVFLVNGTRVR